MTNHKKVISSPEPQLWTFHDYVEGGVNRIEEWYLASSQEVRDAFDALLKNTRKIADHLQWGGFKFLKGEAKSERIWQLDFIADKKQYRALGVFGLARKNAILLLGCYHKGPVYTPRDAIHTACKRAKAFREKRSDTCERQIRENL